MASGENKKTIKAMFIKLLDYKLDIIYRIGINNIIDYYKVNNADFTIVRCVGVEFKCIQESPEQIDELIRQAQPKICTCDDYPDDLP